MALLWELTDLDFADDITLLSDNMADAQRLLAAVEHWALVVGLKINKGKTEYMRLGDFSSCAHPPLRVLAGEIAEVSDFKYLGCWMADSAKDFSVRRALAFKAADKMWRVWKSAVPGELKMRLFLACAEPVLLYGSETRTLTAYITKRLDGCYTRLFPQGQGLDVPRQEDQRLSLRCSTTDLRRRQEQTSCLRWTLRSVH
jgi:hypothetical protein